MVYQCAAIQFVLLANSGASFNNRGISLNNPYLEWKSNKTYYSESDRFLTLRKLITYGKSSPQIFKRKYLLNKTEKSIWSSSFLKPNL